MLGSTETTMMSETQSLQLRSIRSQKTGNMPVVQHYELKSVPQKCIHGSPNPQYCRCGLRDTGLYRGNQFQIRSLEWALIQQGWSSYKKGKFEDKHTHIGRTPHEDESIHWGDASTSQQTAKFTSKPPEARREAWNRLRGNQPCQYILDFSLQNFKTNLCCVSHPSSVVLCYSSSDKLIQPDIF